MVAVLCVRERAVRCDGGKRACTCCQKLRCAQRHVMEHEERPLPSRHPARMRLISNFREEGLNHVRWLGEYKLGCSVQRPEPVLSSRMAENTTDGVNNCAARVIRIRGKRGARSWDAPNGAR